MSTTIKATTTHVPSSQSRLSTQRYRIDQNYLRQFAKNAKILRKQAREIIRAVREGDIEPGAIDAGEVLNTAGGPFKIVGVVQWAGVEDLGDDRKHSPLSEIYVQ